MINFTTYDYGNYNTYGELILDDCNVWDFEFPLTAEELEDAVNEQIGQAEAACLLYTSPSPRDGLLSRMPSSA